MELKLGIFEPLQKPPTTSSRPYKLRSQRCGLLVLRDQGVQNEDPEFAFAAEVLVLQRHQDLFF